MGELAALLSATTWAGTSVALTHLSARISAPVVSTLRLTVASLILPLILLLSGQIDEVTAASLTTLLGIAGSGVLAYAVGDTIYIKALNVIGMQRTFPITMALFIALTVAGGVVLLDEDFAWGLVAGAALIAGGITLLTLANRQGEHEAPRRAIGAGGVGLLLAVGVFWAGATLWLADAANGMSAIPANTVRATASTAVLLAFSLSLSPKAVVRPLLHRPHLAIILGAGIIGTLCGSLAYVYAVTEAGAARTATLNATAPLMALPLSVIFLKEPLTRRAVVGTLACVGGILLVVA